MFLCGVIIIFNFRKSFSRLLLCLYNKTFEKSRVKKRKKTAYENMI